MTLLTKKKRLKQLKLQFLRDNLMKRHSEPDSQLPSVCRSSFCINFLLWLLMFHIQRSRCVHWHLGWLSGGKLKPYPRHPYQRFKKTHSIRCLNMPRRLQMPVTIVDLLSFSLNILPIYRSRPCSSAISWFPAGQAMHHPS